MARHRIFTKWFGGLIGICVALAFIGAELSADLWAAWHISGNDHQRYILVLGTIAGVGWMALGWHVIRGGWSSGGRLMPVVGLVALLAAIFFSFVMELRFYTTAFADQTGAKTLAIERRSDLKEEAARLRARIDALGAVRQSQIVQAEITALLAQPVRGKNSASLGSLGSLTTNCTDTAHWLYRACKPLGALKVELARAQDAAASATRLGAVQALLWNTQVHAHKSDPAAVFLSTFTGWGSEEQWLGVIMLAMILMVKLGCIAAPGLVFGSGAGMWGARQEVEDADFGGNVVRLRDPAAELIDAAEDRDPVPFNPAYDLQAYFADRVKRVENARAYVTGAQLRADYEAWCKANGFAQQDIMSPNEFGGAFAGQTGVKKTRCSNSRYYGIQLARKPPAALGVKRLGRAA